MRSRGRRTTCWQTICVSFFLSFLGNLFGSSVSRVKRTPSHETVQRRKRRDTYEVEVGEGVGQGEVGGVVVVSGVLGLFDVVGVVGEGGDDGCGGGGGYGEQEGGEGGVELDEGEDFVGWGGRGIHFSFWLFISSFFSV